jgi:hypothetical protein
MSTINQFRKSKLLRIKSSDKNNDNDSNSDFVVSFNNIQNLQNVRAISIKSISFPNLVYNIKSQYTLAYTDSVAGAGTVVIPAGQRTMAELLTLIKTGVEVNIASRTLTYTYDDYLKKVSFTVSSGNITFNTSTDTAKYLGITSNLACAPAGTAQDFPDLGGEKSVFLHSSALSDNKYINSEKGNENIICEVPITADFGFLNLYESNSSDTIDLILFPHKKNIHSVDLQLKDEDGEILDLGKQAEIRLVLKIFYD